MNTQRAVVIKYLIVYEYTLLNALTTEIKARVETKTSAFCFLSWILNEVNELANIYSLAIGGHNSVQKPRLTTKTAQAYLLIRRIESPVVEDHHEFIFRDL